MPPPPLLPGVTVTTFPAFVGSVGAEPGNAGTVRPDGTNLGLGEPSGLDGTTPPDGDIEPPVIGGSGSIFSRISSKSGSSPIRPTDLFAFNSASVSSSARFLA